VFLLLIILQRRSLRKSSVVSSGQATSYLLRHWDQTSGQVSNPFIKS